MGAQRYRRVRGSALPALTAAAAPIPNPNKTFKNPISLAGRTGWQTEAWDMLDRVGELRYYVSWRSNSCSRVRLIASELNERGKPTGECADPEVNAIAAAIGGNHLGASQFIRRSVEQLTVPGETFHAIVTTKDGREEWLAVSRDEIRRSGQETII